MTGDGRQTAARVGVPVLVFKPNPVQKEFTKRTGLSKEGEWWTETYCSYTCAAARFLMRAPCASGKAKCNRSDDQWPLMRVWKATKRKEKWRASGVHTFS